MEALTNRIKDLGEFRDVWPMEISSATFTLLLILPWSRWRLEGNLQDEGRLVGRHPLGGHGWCVIELL